jgi:dihydrofolate reductase
MKLIIIAAVNPKRVIGKNGALPWHISEDMKRFKLLTTGHTVLMGRKTFESIGRVLPKRRNVVLSSRPIPDVETYASLEAALGSLHEEEKVFVIGGGELYAQTLPIADEVCLTLVDDDTDGDVFFPPYEDVLNRQFTLRFEERHEGFVFKDYIKK